MNSEKKEGLIYPMEAEVALLPCRAAGPFGFFTSPNGMQLVGTVAMTVGHFCRSLHSGDKVVSGT